MGAEQVKEEVHAFVEQLLGEVETFARGPLFDEGMWKDDLRASLDVAAKIELAKGTTEDLDIAIVTRAARIADLMASERKARRATAGSETKQ